MPQNMPNVSIIHRKYINVCKICIYNSSHNNDLYHTSVAKITTQQLWNVSCNYSTRFQGKCSLVYKPIYLRMDDNTSVRQQCLLMCSSSIGSLLHPGAHVGPCNHFLVFEDKPSTTEVDSCSIHTTQVLKTQVQKSAVQATQLTTSQWRAWSCPHPIPQSGTPLHHHLPLPPTTCAANLYAHTRVYIAVVGTQWIIPLMAWIKVNWQLNPCTSWSSIEKTRWGD